MWLRQTTTTTIAMGPFVDKSDAVTEEEGLAGTMTVYLKKEGGSIGARHSATAISHDSDGWYDVELDSTDTATLGKLTVYAQDPTTHFPVWRHFVVVPPVTYDCWVLGTDNINAEVASVSSSGGNSIADYVLRRSYGSARTSSEGDALSYRSLLGVVAKQVNKITASGGTLIIYHEDDSSIFETSAISTSASADPITDVDPS